MKKNTNRKVKIAFIGGGNMGAALIAALARRKVFRPAEIGLCEPNADRMKALRRHFPVAPFSSNFELARAAQTILLAVKPQQMPLVLEEICPAVTSKHLALSIAAGLDTGYFLRKLPAGTRLIRAMPNMGAQIGEGMTGLFAAKGSTRNDRILAKKIFSAAGKALFVDREEMLDAVTAISGSGPAFVYLFIDSLIQAGIVRGLSPELSRTLVLQTIFGAAKMAECSKEPVTEMIGRVASKGGTTEAGLKILENGHFRDLIRRTIDAATDRAKDLRCMP